MPTVLDRILATKRQEVARAKARISEAEIQRRAAEAPPPRDLVAALGRPGPIRLIAEVKKASPSQGLIRADFDPVAIARAYEAHGAAALSVLTDQKYFQGRLEYLEQVRAVVGIPVLRKDFIIDPYQVVEARAAGADAVLLIAEILTDAELVSLREQAERLGMTALVELYEPTNLPRVLDSGATLVGINNRNLHTFETSLERTLFLGPMVPSDRLLVSESGIRTRQDVAAVRAAGAKAILVGETLMRAEDPAAAFAELLAGGR